MNWKTILVCSALAMFPLGCDSADEDGDDHSTDHDHDTDDHDSHDSHDSHDHESEGHDSHGHDHGETELITTVTLTFTSDAGDTVTASFSDPDGDGGNSGTSEPITLAPDTTYTMTVELYNDLEEEDITPEIREEAEEHQFLFYGPSVTGPGSAGDGLVTHAYDDLESTYGENAVGDDLPVGLANTITTGAAGTGELSVMLRHLPEVNDAPQKEAGLAEAFAQDGEAPGETDVDVSFDVTVE